MVSAFVGMLGIGYLLWLLAGLYVYVSLIRQISSRALTSLEAAPKTFGLPDTVAAAVLISFLLMIVISSFFSQPTELNTRDLAANLILILAVVLILIAFLRFRGFDLDALGGFSKLGILRALSTGAVLLLFAYPLIGLADAITQWLLGSGSSKQSIIELFNGSQTIGQRMLVIVLAVAVAPMAEEFMFRFFIYGVLKRYFGRFIGLAVNALLFAAVHTHLPSFAPLFVLGACFTLAYEWSGSILVSMTMHCLFNSLTLTALAFPQLSSQ